MDDSTLHVEPAALRDGATTLGDHGFEMAGVLRSAADLHRELLGVWSGPAAKVSENDWSDVETALTEHIDRLGEHSQALRTAADVFEAADGNHAAPNRDV